MPTEPVPSNGAESRLLVPLGAAVEDRASDQAIADAMVAAEVALVRAWGAVGVAPAALVEAVSESFGWTKGTHRCTAFRLAAPDLARAAAGSGTPVIALAASMREAAAPEVAAWIHRGATSQDIVDTALMAVAVDVARVIGDRLDEATAALDAFATTHADVPVAARTLTQHAVPTTAGLRARTWAHAIDRAARRVREAADRAPAQLGGAAGTAASFVEVARVEGHGVDAARDRAARLPSAFAREMGLTTPDLPWHTARWPVTELADALVQAADALGVMAADVATLSRTEIGELNDPAGGGSSAMPHKRNPAAAVLIRSAAIRAPHLGATLHSCAALAVDERPDGAWHGEWPALQELLRLTHAAATRAAELAGRLELDTDRAAANLSLTGTALVSERLTIAREPLLGAERVRSLLEAASEPAVLRERLAALPELAGSDLDGLLDAAAATGLAATLARDTAPAREGS